MKENLLLKKEEDIITQYETKIERYGNGVKCTTKYFKPDLTDFTIDIQEGELPEVIIEGGKLPRTDKHIDLTDEQCLELTRPVVDIKYHTINLHNRDRILKNIKNGL